MKRFLKNRSQTVGNPPGTLVFIGNRKLEKPRIRVISYNKDELIEKEAASIKEAGSYIDNSRITWINIDGLHDTSIISETGDLLGINSLALEDILNTDHRPRLFEEGNHLIIIAKNTSYSDNSVLRIDQVSMVVGENYLVTFQETTGTMFNPLRERLRHNSGRIRVRGSDYLCYGLVDTLIDNYYGTLTRLGEIIDAQEEELINIHDTGIVSRIYSLKKETLMLRKSIRPLKEVTNSLLRSDSSLLDSDTRAYFIDLDELITQAAETVEIYYTLTNDHLSLYHANVSNGANAVMKVLTIFASIFIPLTFIAGVYGTNFSFVPEYGYRYSYFIMLGVMVVITLIMLYYFRKKRWL